MANGYMGKILRLNLTNRTVTTINTSDYEEWGGGHGMGSAIFWDLAVAPGNWDMLDGFDSRNVVTMMTSPTAGTMVPGAGGRTEVQGIGVYPFPIGWFTRSNFGGMFAGQLKYAGWDGIVIEGKATSPVWINIVNDDVTIEDAGPDGDNLWGLDTWETQEEIWRIVTNNAKLGEWVKLPGGESTTQRPAVVTIGPAGENLARVACLLHGGGSSAGQGGFGGVFGSKNLKAISVLGTQSVEIANPEALVDARVWYNRTYQYNADDPRNECPLPDFAFYGGLLTRSPGAAPLLSIREPYRPTGCTACPIACRRRTASGTHNESQCVDALWYGGRNATEQMKATELDQRYGINVYDGIGGAGYLRDLYELGVLGPGKEIESNLPFELFGSLEWAAAYTRQVAFREGIGDDLAEGLARATTKWGRYKEDTDSGLLAFPQWGYNEHYDPRLEVDWSYGSILGDRDINEHGLNWAVHWMPEAALMVGEDFLVSAERLVEILSEKTPPYTGDPFMFDYSEGPDGIYSDSRVKTIAWLRHYTRFWQQSILYCCWVWPLFVSPNSPDVEGPTPEGEPMFLEAVTGNNLSFTDGMEIGRKIWNLDRAIWILQGRHRDMEVHSGYVYNVPTIAPYQLPVYENGEWSYSGNIGRTLDRVRFEEWKTKFFEFEGWDASSGWPTRATLAGLSLGHVADRLEAAGKLGT